MKNWKTCSLCKEAKKLNQFNMDKQKIEGLPSKCKECLKKYYIENKEAKLIKAKENLEKSNKLLEEYNHVS